MHSTPKASPAAAVSAAPSKPLHPRASLFGARIRPFLLRFPAYFLHSFPFSRSVKPHFFFFPYYFTLFGEQNLSKREPKKR
jgi:hypothetical protein